MPVLCWQCGQPATHYITYRDPEREEVFQIRETQVRVPTQQFQACDQHVEMAAAQILKDQGLYSGGEVEWKKTEGKGETECLDQSSQG